MSSVQVDITELYATSILSLALPRVLDFLALRLQKRGDSPSIRGGARFFLTHGDGGGCASSCVARVCRVTYCRGWRSSRSASLPIGLIPQLIRTAGTFAYFVSESSNPREVARGGSTRLAFIHCQGVGHGSIGYVDIARIVIHYVVCAARRD